MEELRAEVENKSRMLLEVKGHLKQLAEREREKKGQQSLVAKRERHYQRTSQDGELLLELPLCWTESPLTVLTGMPHIMWM